VTTRHIVAIWTLVLLAHVMCGTAVDAEFEVINEENES
jgi:hypothetical protein